MRKQTKIIVPLDGSQLAESALAEALTLAKALNAEVTLLHAIPIREHNSHVGDAAATEMGTRGEHNVGQLSRVRFAESAYLVGFGTDHGTVAAASDWDGPMQIKRVRPSRGQL